MPYRRGSVSEKQLFIITFRDLLVKYDFIQFEGVLFIPKSFSRILISIGILIVLNASLMSTITTMQLGYHYFHFVLYNVFVQVFT